LFAWVPTLVSGLKEENMNLDPDLDDHNVDKQNTSLPASERQKLLVHGIDVTNADVTANTRLTVLEVENIREFWDNDIKNKPALEVHKIFKRMFKDVRNSKLKKYIISSVSNVVGQTFAFVGDLVLNICKETSNPVRLTFLFGLFAKQQKQMRGKAIKDFIEIFRLPMQVFKLATFLSLGDFLAELEHVDVDYSALLAAKPMMIAMTAITPETDEDEREAILAAMNGNKNLETLIYETLPDE